MPQNSDNAAGRRMLQAAVAVLSLVPIVAGGAGVLLGPAFVEVPAAGIDADSHFRYLSGLLLGLGLVFVSCIPAIERRTARFRISAAVVVCGGLARLLALALHGTPGLPHLFGLTMELVVVPGLVVWQARVARAAGV